MYTQSVPQPKRQKQVSVVKGKISFLCDADWYRQVRVAAAGRDVTVSALTQAAIAQFLGVTDLESLPKALRYAAVDRGATLSEIAVAAVTQYLAATAPERAA